MEAFKSYIGRDFGRPNISYGRVDSASDTLPIGGDIRDWGFGWMGVDENKNAVINGGYIATFGGIIGVGGVSIGCTGSFENPGIIFCQLTRGLNPVDGSFSGFVPSIICTSLSGFSGHTNDAWRFPLYTVYIDSDGYPKYKQILGIGLICL